MIALIAKDMRHAYKWAEDNLDISAVCNSALGIIYYKDLQFLVVTPLTPPHKMLSYYFKGIIFTESSMGNLQWDTIKEIYYRMMRNAF